MLLSACGWPGVVWTVRRGGQLRQEGGGKASINGCGLCVRLTQNMVETRGESQVVEVQLIKNMSCGCCKTGAEGVAISSEPPSRVRIDKR